MLPYLLNQFVKNMPILSQISVISKTHYLGESKDFNICLFVMEWRHFVDNDISWTLFFKMGDFSWTLSRVTSCGHFLVTSHGRFCPREVLFLGEFSWTLFDGDNKLQGVHC